MNSSRRKTVPVTVGNIVIGGRNAIRLQSMTTTNTNDTEACVAQAKRIIKAGGELVRLTTQGSREAENMKNISESLKHEGITTPLVADVHFNANVADVAAQYAEKVRINPGNYVDPARTFRHLEYTDEEYRSELSRIEQRLTPFIAICKEHHTAVRIGVNHGSLSDRIMSRYGDTPAGIVESCMEFLRIFRKLDFNNVVISIKASNTVVMVESVRLLVQTMNSEDMHYPLHLGVTEAGEGEDGRVKSAVGIGSLLQDGIGDTVRVSLSEEPECEIPVARSLVDYATAYDQSVEVSTPQSYSWTAPVRRQSARQGSIGDSQVPVVVAIGQIDDKSELQPDYQIIDGKSDFEYCDVVFTDIFDDGKALKTTLKNNPSLVCMLHADAQHVMKEVRSFVFELENNGLHNPVVLAIDYQEGLSHESFLIHSAADCGSTLIDGLVDGLCLTRGGVSTSETCSAAFAILQAARQRMTRTEYISCPGCGRTMYDLQHTIARIKAATAHLSGLKIGIMGCIVNGPGEMADADYGYVGAGRDRISLYRKKECVEKNIPQDEAVEHLLRLIENDQQKK